MAKSSWFYVPLHYTILGTFTVTGDNIDERITFVGIERQNDTHLSLYQSSLDRNKVVNTVILPMSAFLKIHNKKTVVGKLVNGKKVKIKRIN